MASAVRNRFQKIKEGAIAKTKPSGWILPQEKGALGDEGTW
jgi:NCS1 family nucleobase:cation symporter-1